MIKIKGKTHLAFGLGTGCLISALAYSNDIKSGLILIGCSALGSLLPDIDSPTSTISKRAHITSHVVNKMCGHRGFFHSPLCCLIINALTLFILWATNNMQNIFIVYGLLCGYTGHLLLDMLTKGGIPLLFPFSKEKIHLTNVKTGGVGEGILFIFACIATIGIFTFTVIQKAV